MTAFQQNHFALNSEIVLTVRTKDEKVAKAFFNETIRQIDAFEKRFSRFLPESELSKLNESAGSKLAASPALIGILETAKKMAIATDGLYNPFVLPSLQKAGYVGSWPRPDKFAADLNYQNRQINPISGLEIGPDWIRIPKNSAIDLGGIGKGYLLDQLVEMAHQKNIASFWFSLGGDIIFNGNSEGIIGWEVGVADAKDETKDVATLKTLGKKVAVATSGTIKRKGGKWHHIIDPRTGQPATTDILAATVITESATLADVFAKSLVILGSKKAVEFVDKNNVEQVYLQTDQADQSLIILGVKNG